MAKDDEVKRIEDMTNEEMQKEILRVELQTKQILLAKTKKDLVDFEGVERKRRENNRRRMDELRSAREARARVVAECRHRSGGTPKNILKGKGVGSFSTISRTMMPDGDTILLQCPRCRMMLFTPRLPKNPTKDQREEYVEAMDEFNRLLQDSIEEGLEHAELRGPTFSFKKDGVPFIPERV